MANRLAANQSRANRARQERNGPDLVMLALAETAGRSFMVSHRLD